MLRYSEPPNATLLQVLKCELLYAGSYWAILSCGTRYYAVHDSFLVCRRNSKTWAFKLKLLNSTFLWSCLLCCQVSSNFWDYRSNPGTWAFKRKLLSNTFLWCCILYCTKCSWICGWNPKWNIQIKLDCYRSVPSCACYCLGLWGRISFISRLALKKKKKGRHEIHRTIAQKPKAFFFCCVIHFKPFSM